MGSQEEIILQMDRTDNLEEEVIPEEETTQHQASRQVIPLQMVSQEEIILQMGRTDSLEEEVIPEEEITQHQASRQVIPP
jgi:hypothetical protein